MNIRHCIFCLNRENAERVGSMPEAASYLDIVKMATGVTLELCHRVGSQALKEKLCETHYELFSKAIHKYNET